MADDWTEYVDDRLRFRLRHPVAWYTQPYLGMLRPHFSGVFVANVPEPFRPENTRSGTGNRWPPSMTALPPTTVVVAFDHMAGGPVHVGGGIHRETPLPLSLHRAGHSLERGFERFTIRPIRMNGSARYSLYAWMGPDARIGQREIGEAIAASIGPAAP